MGFRVWGSGCDMGIVLGFYRGLLAMQGVGFRVSVPWGSYRSFIEY